MNSLIINLSFAVFHRQSLSCEVIDKSQGDIDSPNSKYSLFALPGRFQLRYYCSKFPPRFSVCKLGRSIHFIPLFSNFCCSRRMIHTGNCCLAPSPVGFNRPIISQSLFLESRVRIRPLRSLRIICFRNFSQHAHAPPLKTPLAPSPACINYSIIFESLLLPSDFVQIPGRLAPDSSFSKFHSLPPSTRKKALQGLP